VLDHLDKLFELRYPNRNVPTEIGTEDLELANKIMEKLWKLIPEDLINAFENLPKGTKSGRVLMIKPEDQSIDEKLIIK